MSAGLCKHIILGMALLLFGVEPSSFLYSQTVDSLACHQADSIFRKTNFRKKPNESIPALEETLQITGEGRCDELYIRSLNAMAVTYYYLRNYIEARKYAQQATDASRLHFGENSRQYATSIANLSVFIEVMGNYNKSIELQLESIRIEETFEDNARTMADAMENLGISYIAIGDFGLARSYYEQALQHLSKVKKRTGAIKHRVARLNKGIATCAWAKGQIKEAQRFFQNSLDTIMTLPLEIKRYAQIRWSTFKDLAELHLGQEQYDLALSYIRQALELQQQFSLNDAYKSYLTMGDIQLAIDQPNEALSYYEEAAKVAGEEYAIYKKHAALAIPVASQAKVYTAEQNYAQALAYYDQARELITLEDDQFIQSWAALDVLAGRTEALYEFYLQTGDQQKLEATLNDCRRISQLIQEIRYSYTSDDPKNSLAERAVPIIERGIATALQRYQDTQDPSFIDEAFTFAESNKALLLYESMREMAARGGAGIPDSLLEKGEELRDGLSFLKRQILENQQKAEVEESKELQRWKGEVFDLENAYQEWVGRMEKEYPLYHEQKYKTKPVSVDLLRQQLKEENSAVIAFMLGPKQAYVFCLSAEALQAFSLGESAALIAAANQLRSLIASPPTGGAFKDNYEAFVRQSQQLYAHLLEQSLATLPADIQHLTIIPDDVLSLLPFELLLQKVPDQSTIDFSPDHLDYLFEQYTISYDYSASLMHALHARQRSEAAPKTFIGFAPSFGEETVSGSRACTENNLYSLRCNGEEVSAIHALLGGEALQAEAALLKAFRQEAQNYQIVHLATHACVDEETAALSKIYFTDANLTPYELNNLHFNADLTVLSACNTGGGKVLRGEGVISLARSFMLAGSQSVLTSLWSVDDCATSDMMVHYYEGLKQGQSKAEALKSAKLSYLTTADVYNRHPSYWAAFVQFGDIGKMDLGGGWQQMYWLLLAGFLIGLGLLGRRLLKKETNSTNA